MSRTTKKVLESLAATLNEVTGQPPTPYSRGEDGKWHANVGNFHVDYAYGGAELHQISSEGGGCTPPVPTGHVSKREVALVLRGMIAGARAQISKSSATTEAEA